MPNPFTRLQAKTSRDPVERTIPTGAIEPTPERVPGTLFAYRGQQTHGVPTDLDASAVDEDMYGEASRYDVNYEPPEDEGPEPIAVRIVETDYQVEMVRGTVTQMTATGTDKGTNASQLVGNDFTLRTRTKVRIKNLAATVIYINTESRLANAQFGWPLAQNETFESSSQEAWYGVGSVAAESPVAVYTEYVVGATHDKRGRHGD